MKHYFNTYFLRLGIVIIVSTVLCLGLFLFPVFLAEVRYTSWQILPSRPLEEKDFCHTDPSNEAWELCIPSIYLKTSTMDGEGSTNDITALLEKGVVRLAQSASPGEPGNAVFFGHSDGYFWNNGPYKTIFALLNKLEKGDEIIFSRHGEIIKYHVTQKRVVNVNDVSVLESSPSIKQVTLVTCWPPGTTLKRLVVEANAKI